MSATATATAFTGPTGTPCVSPILCIPEDDAFPLTALTSPPFPMPLSAPRWAPPPTASQLADPDDPCHCPRHTPSAGFTRNTNGRYSSHAPLCSGCRQGTQEDEELAAATRVTNAETSLRNALHDRHPNSDEITTTAAELYTSILALEVLTTAIPTPADYGRRAIRIWETARSLHAAYVRDPTATNTELFHAYLTHIDSCDRFTPTTRIATDVLAILNQIPS
jgi:hypothetical protein